jgi:hypothetical protein
MRTKRDTLILLGVMLLGILATTASASAPKVLFADDFDATW